MTHDSCNSNSGPEIDLQVILQKHPYNANSNVGVAGTGRIDFRGADLAEATGGSDDGSRPPLSALPADGSLRRST